MLFILSRINSSRQTTDTHGQAQTERLNMLAAQRDYYQGAFDNEFGRLVGSIGVRDAERA